MTAAAADERLLGEAREREARALDRREARARGALAAAFVVTASVLAWALPAGRSAAWWELVAFVAAYAGASRIRFEVAAGVALPTVVVLVPGLFDLPARDIPLLVLAGVVLGAAGEALYRRLPVGRAVVVAASSSWFALGPAIVFAAAGEPRATAPSAFVVAMAAVAAQLLADAAGSSVGEWAALGISPRELVRPLRDTFVLDLLLAPVGFFAALAETIDRVAVLLPTPFLVLLLVFARERSRRLDRVLGLLDEVRASDAQLRELAAAIPEVLFLFSVEPPGLLYVSSAYETVWGRPVPDLPAGADAWRTGIHADDLHRVLDELAAAPERVVESSFRVVHPDGQIRWVVYRLTPVRDAAGRVLRVAGVARDLSEQRTLEEQLRQSQKMEAVGQLAGGVAHDFNNLLTVIRGHAELALPRLSDDETREDLRQINEAADRAAALTRQILAFSRRQVMEPAVICLNDVVRQTDALIRGLIGPDVLVRLELGEELGPILADAGQVGQVVMNLAINARDAMPDGGILTIRTEDVVLDERAAPSRELAVGPYVRLAVSDTGTGMSAETVRRIFEPFYTTKEPGKGTGLGLSTCYGIVKQSGGHLEVTSELGRGTTFELWFPRTTAEAEAGDAPGEPAAPADAARVLLVEDEDVVRTVVQQLLEGSGFAVRAVSGPAPAIRAWAAEGPFDVLLTDLSMPEMTGQELVARLVERGADPAVVFMSGFSMERVDGRLGSSAVFVQKPFTAEGLAAAVRTALRESPGSVTAASPIGGEALTVSGRPER